MVKGLNPFKYITKIFSSFWNNLLEERQNWILWIPVLFGFGIWSYFFAKTEPNIYINIAIFGISTLLATILLKIKQQATPLSLILTITAIIFLGNLWANIYTIHIDSPKIPENMSNLEVVGKIDEITFHQKGDKEVKRFIILPSEIVATEDFPKSITNDKNSNYSAFDENGVMHNLPKKIRINVGKNEGNIGDIVKFTTTLGPPPNPVFPNAYDFAKKAYFQQIGGTGTAQSMINVVSPAAENKTVLANKIDITPCIN